VDKGWDVERYAVYTLAMRGRYWSVALCLWLGCTDTPPPSGGPPADAAPPDAMRIDAEAGSLSDSDAQADAAIAPDSSSDSGSSSRNLIVDGGFERGDEAWALWGGARRAEGEGHRGAYALESTGRNGAEQRVEGVEPNTVYRLSGWGRSEGDEPILLGVKEHGRAQEMIVYRSAEFERGELFFTTSFGTESVVIFVYKHVEGGSGYVDEVRLERVGPSSLELIWSDEFTGSGAVDETRWAHEAGFVRNEELQWYQPENAFRQDGVLVLEGRRESRVNPAHVPGSTDWRTRRETIEYTSASLRTRDLFSFRYGRVVVRAKVTNAAGTWPAIWTLGASCEWPSCGEVDIMENYAGNLLANFAWGTDRRWTPRWESSRTPVSSLEPGFTESFHIWELEWSESRMAILLDGVVLNTLDLDGVTNGSAACAGENPFRQSHYLMLNLALGGAGGSVDGLSFPTRYLVDYVRVYQ